MYQKIVEIIEGLFDRNNLEPVISRDIAYLDSIKSAIASGEERFAFVVDLVDKKLKHQMGMEWLEYHNPLFDLREYFQAVHPKYLQMLNQLATSTLEIAHNDSTSTTFDRKVIVQFPLRTSTGRYLFCKRTVTIFSLAKETTTNRTVVTAYLNDFVIIGNYEDGEPKGLAPRVLAGRIPDNYLEKQWKEKVKGQFLKSSLFSKTEQKIIKWYFEEKFNSAEKVALEMGGKISTVYVHHRNILKKAFEIFGVEFKDVFDFVSYLRKEELL
jgi:hypothetical protein